MNKYVIKKVNKDGELTMMTSMGMGTGSLALYLSFNSLTMNTTTIITIAMTRSHMLVEVI